MNVIPEMIHKFRKKYSFFPLFPGNTAIKLNLSNLFHIMLAQQIKILQEYRKGRQPCQDTEVENKSESV